MKYIDFHCDTLLSIYGSKAPSTESLYENQHSVDFCKMKQGGCAAQFFATFLPPRASMGDVSDETLRLNTYNGLMKEISEHADMIAFARTYEDYQANQQKGLMSAFLTFEDGRMVEGSHDKLAQYYDLGYRLISFTWNGANCFGFPNSSDPVEMKKGLTPFGLEAVEQMNELGMIIDVSHLSDGGFYDVVSATKKPFVASHSNARSLTPHQRNMTDEMIRLLAEKGGLMGINFAPGFLAESMSSQDSTVARICDHIEYITNLAGIETVGLGSDWDGIQGNLEVASPLDLDKIFHELSKRGFSAADIEKFAYGNAERILKDVLS